MLEDHLEPPFGPTGAILRSLPSPYTAHHATGLLYLPRFIAKIRWVKKHGELPKSYRKNYKRGFDRFLCMHLGVDPGDVEKIVMTHDDQATIDSELLKLFPENVMAAEWNREMTHKGISAAGREFIVESLTKMGCPEKIEEIVCVADMMDFDEGRIPGYDVEKAITLGTD
ncbi:MAG: DUF5069 domain-containing protein [Verrucomicrobiota bacterium]